MHLYERIVSDLVHQIERGALRPGDRLPSVRVLSAQRSVSVATVLQAYLQLEGQGHIETRPKAGHFVRQRRAPLPPVPRSARPVSSPAKVHVTSGVGALARSLRDPTVVPLGAACVSPDLLPLGQLNRLLSSLARELRTAGGSYEAPPGPLTLRRQIARRATALGMGITEEEVVTTVGAAEALLLALRAVARSGDAVAVESPTYFGILQLIEGLGLRAIEVPVHPEHGMDLGVLEQVLRTTPVRACIAMPNFNNPLGVLMPEEAKERLVQLLLRHDVPLIEDDVYGDLPLYGPRPRPAKAFDRHGRVLLCGSISKTLAPGYRVGWIVPGRYQETVEQLQFSQTVAPPTLPQLAVAEFLDGGGYDRHLRRLRPMLKGQIERFSEAIAVNFPRGTRVSRPAGGFVLWLELPGGISAAELQVRALQVGISIAPGSIFAARDRFANCVRINCGHPWSPRIEQAIRTLGELSAGRPAR